jgi:hypothetical protein
VEELISVKKSVLIEELEFIIQIEFVMETALKIILMMVIIYAKF